MNKTILAAIVAALSILAVGPATAEPARDAILADLLLQAKTADGGFGGFAAERGKGFFLASPASGKPDTPSCTTCHTPSPQNTGKTRAGKEIKPMAVSANPARFTDPAEVEKWFGRNCNSVLGRDCTAAEKGDFITFMASQ